MSETFPDDQRLSSFPQRFAHEAFDPTAVRPIISPSTQTRPKAIPSIEQPSSVQNTPPRFAPSTNSPKRPMPLDESDNEANRPRKLARGESPLKGAAGRRLDQQKRNRQPLDGHYDGQAGSQPMTQSALPRDVMFLLSIIPKSSTYHATRFNPQEMVRLIRETPIPSQSSQLRPPPPPPSVVGMQHMPPLPQGQFNSKLPFSYHLLYTALSSVFWSSS